MALSGSITSRTITIPDTGGKNKYLQLTWTASQSVENNTSTISWTLSTSGTYPYWVYYSKTKVVIDGQTVYWREAKTAQEAGVIASSATYGTVTLTHDSQGDRSFSVSISAGIYDHAVNATASGTWALNNIPRASTVTAAGMKFGESGTLNITRADPSFKDGVHWAFGSQIGSIVADEDPTSDATVTWTPPASLMNEIPSATSGEVQIIVHTFNSSGTLIASRTSLITVTVPDEVVPTATVTRTNTVATFGVYTQGISKCRVQTTAAGAYGSTITSITTTCEGVSYSGSDITTNLLTGSGSVAVTTVVKDSRGRTATVSGSITVYAYSTPAIELTVHRCDAGGTADEMGSYASVWIHATGTAIGSGAKANAVTPSLKMRQVGTEAWTDVSVTPTGTAVDKEVSMIIGAADTYSWEFMATSADKVSSISSTVTISVGYATIDFLKGGRGIAFGTTALTAGFKCAMDADFTGDTVIGGLRIRAGTKSPVALSGTEHALFTYAELNTLFGTNDCGNENVVVLAQNGDYAVAVIVDGTMNTSSGVSIHTTAAFSNVNIRVNYIAIHF